MSEYFYTKKEAEKAILVGVALQSENISYDIMCEYLDELAFLAETAGAETVKIFTQNLDKPVTATFIGKGKLEEIKTYVEENDIDLIIFDDELSPTQIRNLERELKGRKVLDRTNLILDIFAKRARTAEAKAQVELAQYQYLLPRLTGMWTHLERQKGGIGLRGPGETEIETDRRIIRDKISRLKNELTKIDKQKVIQRKNRGKLVRVSLAGYTNVGKSTLFNRLIGHKLAIVHDQPGVTRDRKEAKGKLQNMALEVIDTAGYEYSKEDSLEKRMWEQTRRAIGEADVCLFLFDARDGIQPYDEHFADLVRQSGKPVILLANKCEGRLQEDSVHEAYRLGLGEPIPFSAEHGLGLLDLYEALKPFDKKEEKTEPEFIDFEGLSEEEINAVLDEKAKAKPIQLAIVGRPNVGKSTLVNALLNDERMLTGPEAGVTRDAITSEWEWKGRKINLVDTAGLRRQSRVEDSLEKMSAASTKHAAYMAQVVVLVLDADAVLDKQDLTIAREVIDEGRALVIAVNKWDIANRREALQKLNDKLQTSLTQAEGVPTVTISALKKEGLDKLMSAVFKVYDRWNVRIPTAPLNKWFEDIKDNCPPPLGKNKRRIKLRYITQAKTRPPSFYMFSSNPEGLPDSYLRYLTNSLRETFNLGGIPIRLNVRKTGNPYADKKERRNPLRKMAKPKE